MTPDTAACPVCGLPTEPAGSKESARAQRTFLLRHCPSCRFTFIANAWTAYAEIYDEAYYRGRGADPMVDYVQEMNDPRGTIRVHEWAGILEAVSSLTPIASSTRWLDYGCGNAMLVRHVRDTARADAIGFEEGWIADEARRRGMPVVRAGELAAFEGTCDVVSAIEVLEHVTDPLGVLRSIRRLLKPGGLFFYTTGNARPHRGRVAEWPYCIPEIHVSFYEPGTLETALHATGFKTTQPGYLPGYTDIIRFKALKNLGYTTRGGLQRALPWGIVSRILDSYMGILKHPIAWAV